MGLRRGQGALKLNSEDGGDHCPRHLCAPVTAGGSLPRWAIFLFWGCEHCDILSPQVSRWLCSQVPCQPVRAVHLADAGLRTAITDLPRRDRVADHHGTWLTRTLNIPHRLRGFDACFAVPLDGQDAATDLLQIERKVHLLKHSRRIKKAINTHTDKCGFEDRCRLNCSLGLRVIITTRLLSYIVRMTWMQPLEKCIWQALTVQVSYFIYIYIYTYIGCDLSKKSFNHEKTSNR